MSFEGAYRANRTEYVVETTTGQPVADPTWLAYADALLAWVAAPGHQIGVVRGIGNVDPLDFQPGREEPSAMVRYYLQRTDLTTDAIEDGIVRLADGGLPSHHIVNRHISDLTGGEDGDAVRLYTVVEGAKVARASIRGAANEDPPKVIVELQYAAEKVREYRIDQPDSGGVTLTIESTDATDTTQTVTIEDDGAVASEGNTLTGTTPVVTTKTDWTSIDAIRLDAETKGNVIVKVSVGGETLATLYGTDAYDGAEGDLGIPLLGSGSHASAVGSSYVSYLGSVTTYGGSDIAEKMRANDLVVDNAIEVIPTNTRRAALEVGERDIQLSVDVFGKAESYNAMVRNLTAEQQTLVWVVTGGASNNEVTLAGAALLTSPEQRVELGQTVAILQQQFGATGLTIT